MLSARGGKGIPVKVLGYVVVQHEENVTLLERLFGRESRCHR